MIPTPIYEALPYLYMLVGLASLISIDLIAAKLCGLILVVIGAVIYRTRRRYRHQKLRLNDLKGNKGWARKTEISKRNEAKSDQDFQKGEDSYERGNYTEAVRGYRKAADQGNASAQVNLGAMYAEGLGVARDFQEALHWYREAARQGEAVACFNLGVMYIEGQGVARNLQEALKWHRQAAAQGHAQAQFSLGLMYEENADALSLQEAAQWYSKAAEQGYAPAQVNLGALYIEGRGVARDVRKALKWYQEAAQQNYAPAQFNLGIMCFEGHEGVAKDWAMAYVWFAQAAQQGDKDAQDMQGQISARLNAEQKIQIQQLLSDAKAKNTARLAGSVPEL